MKKKKKKVVYYEDTGETVYSMAALNGRTPEEQDELDKKRKNAVEITGRERWAMIRAAFNVYAPPLLCFILSFLAVALLMYFFLR